MIVRPPHVVVFYDNLVTKNCTDIVCLMLKLMLKRPSQRLRSGRDVVSIYGTFTQNIQQVLDI